MAEPPLTILFEDAHCLAIAKRAGELTQGTASGDPTVEEAVRGYLGAGGGGPAYLGTVHRLDRPVSGVLLWAKTPKAARRLAAQFAAREVSKEYWAVVEGDAPAPGARGTWDDRLTAADASGLVRVAADPHARGARRATTGFRAEAAPRLPEGLTWLRLWPETGRTHQLRVQAAHRGHPIVGDSAYGSTRPFAGGIALHARSLRVRHPTRNSPLHLVAPVPDAWEEQGITLPEADGPGGA
jgi:23S rRNA pseudouridine1911/1915/1917 synthase